MAELLYIEINGFALAVLAVLLINLRRSMSALMDERLFRAMLMLVAAVLVCDTVGWTVNGHMFPGARTILLLANTMYFVLSGGVLLAWMLYTDYKLSSDMAGLRRRSAYYIIPFLVHSALAIATPITGWLFYLDGGNRYCRGTLFWAQAAIITGMLLASCLRALWKTKGELLPYRRKEYLILASFAILPLLGGLVQAAFFGLPMIWACTAVSLLTIFINMQNHQISLDGLTGVNNRRTLNRYIETRLSELRPGQSMTMLLMDIDSSKKINDSYGHASGDAALIRSAALLKQVCGKADAMLARYGGDEFAVVMDGGDEACAAGLRKEISSALEELNREGSFPFPLSLSIGGAGIVCGEPGGMDTLITRADKAMYEEKKKKK